MIRRVRREVFPAKTAALGVAMVVLAAAGCAGSAPVRAVRAARYYAAGTDALERGETRSAIEALEQAVGLMPHASEIHNHLGLAYWSDGREDAALRELERAVELDCENEAARGNLDRLRAAMEPTRGASGEIGEGGESGPSGVGVDSSGASVLPAGIEGSSLHGG